ncbi:14_t:CDS:2, partial [Scutellospora calospora]
PKRYCIHPHEASDQFSECLRLTNLPQASVARAISPSALHLPGSSLLGRKKIATGRANLREQRAAGGADVARVRASGAAGEFLEVEAFAVGVFAWRAGREGDVG